MEEPDPGEERAIQEDSSEEESSKLSWIMNKGFRVGKKVLVTAFVISSAPLVLPPLLVFSFIGFACSVPSGLFLASYAFTDKLMSKLLPGSTPPHFLLDYGTVQDGDEEYDVEKKEEEALDDSWGNGYQGYAAAAGYEDEKEEEQGGGIIELKIESIMEEKEKPGMDAAVVGIAGDDIIDDRTSEEEGALVPAFAVTNVVIELCQSEGSEESEELRRQTRGLLEKIQDEGITENVEEKQSSDKPIEEREPIEPIEGLLRKRDGDNTLEAEKLKVEKSLELEEERADENIINKEKAFVISTNADSRDSYDKNNDSQQSSYTVPDTVEGEYGNAKISSQKDFGMVFNEVTCNEKTIWQQIEAMRRIVGYKAAKQATCLEELNALYIFTGVELPASLKDPSELLEINDKLRFLMSIVGVK